MDHIIDLTVPCFVDIELALTKDGYAVFDKNDYRTLAHKMIYEKFHGSIPRGKQLDHLCSNRACLETRHMEIVEPKINTRRGRLAKLTQRDIDDIRYLKITGSRNKDISRQFGISSGHVADIFSGRRWA